MLVKYEHLGRTLIQRPHDYWVDFENLIEYRDEQGVHVNMESREWSQFCVKWNNFVAGKTITNNDGNKIHFIPPKQRWQNAAGQGAGPILWGELHRRPLICDLATEHLYLETFAKRLYCDDCARDWLFLLKQFPLDLTSKESYFRWTVSLHNEINSRLHKPQITFEDAARIHGFPLTYTDSVVFLPHIGEFGWMILNYIRYVYSHPAKNKIVCCNIGEECLFPNATSFFYNWSNPIPDHKRTGQSGWSTTAKLHTQLNEQLRIVLAKQYPGASIQTVPEGSWLRCSEIKFKPQTSNHLSEVDVAIVARHRQFAMHRNWKHWAYVIDKLHDRGLRVGLLGLPATSARGIKAEAYAWDHPQGATAGSVDLLNHCRLFVGNDTGIAHLACMMDVPSYIFFDPDAYSMLDTMQWTHKGYLNTDELKAWLDPDYVVQRICENLYYSGAEEDRIVESFLPSKGYFVEVGGGDGFKQSNTLHYELKGWSGAIFEPDPRFQKSISQRKCNIYPKAIVANLDQSATLFLDSPGRASMLPKSKEKVSVEATHLEIIVPSDRHVDLLSIDTEGTELEIWNSLSRLRPTILIIEANREQEIIEAVTNKGYTLLRKTSDNNLIFKRLSLCMVTVWTPEISDIAAMTMPSKAAYCDHWNYDYKESDHNLDTKRFPHWSKLSALIEQVPNYDWLFWSDADALIMNNQIELATFIDQDYDLIWSTDGHGPNAGNFLIRCCPTILKWLEASLNRYDDLKDHPMFDQEALVQESLKYDLKIKIVPRTLFNSYTEEYKPGELLAHAAGNFRDKIEAFKKLL